MRGTRAVVLVVVTGVLSCAPPAPAPAPRDVELAPAREADRHGKALPAGAVARLHKLNDNGVGAGSRGLSFSPDGSLLAFVAQDGDTRIWDVKTETELHRFGHNPVHFPTGHDRRVFTTDGKLLFGDGGRVWDVATGKSAEGFGPAPKPGDTPLSFPIPSPDGKSVLFLTYWGAERGEVVVFDIATRKEVRRFGKGTRVGGPLVFSPDGKTLATAKDPVPVPTPLGGPRKGERPAPPADGQGGVMLWDWATGEKKAEWRSQSFAPWYPLGFSDDGKTLYVLDNETLASWDVATGKLLGKPFGYWMRRAVLLPDRKTLAVVEPQGLALWSIPDEKQIGKVERPVAWTVDMAPSPSGRWLATGGNDGEILIWDVDALRKKP